MKINCFGGISPSCSACSEYNSCINENPQAPIADFSDGARFLSEIDWSPSPYIAMIQAAHEICKRRGASFFAVICPNLSWVRSPSVHEQFLLSIRFGDPKLGKNYVGSYLSWSRTCPENRVLYEDLDAFSPDYRNNIFADVQVARDASGFPFQTDYTSRWVNVLGGQRLTTGQPLSQDRTLHVFGASETYGMGCEDRHTIPSFLQQRFNQYHKNNPKDAVWRVCNYGVRGISLSCSLVQLWRADLAPEDCVILFCSRLFLPQKVSDSVQRLRREISANTKEYHRMGIPLIDARHIFDRPHTYGELFFNDGHFSYKGNRVLADVLFNHIAGHISIKESKNKKKSVPSGPQKTQVLKMMNSSAFEYLDFLRKNARFPKSASARIGATVMNANPFTRGHSYLIEKAASMIDHLYVFVVQEDKSYFPFDARLKLVELGTKHLDSVTVLPSGPFMVSSTSFPEYFDKQNCQDVRIDAVRNILPFCLHVAPLLGITHRFVGEEPFCNITSQNDEQLKIICPEYGIEVIVIPRLMRCGRFVSASFVRRLYKNKDWKAIAQLVPSETSKWLKIWSKESNSRTQTSNCLGS